MAKIKGNNDGVNGRNETYDVGSRKNVPRKQVVKEVKNGQHPGYHIYQRGDQEYVRDNPDGSKKDNINE
ncbi:DUF3892 domain-containing protein [Legionella sp. CNM-1927-20]|uniref:DUF3892 domain-containing protein n=1 Tax=Legionella sp. CNM-1927-20 TaxID=3422221 RepID=UPI00403B1E3D